MRLPAFDAALCVFGVSYFECLQANVPTIVFDPLQAATGAEWELLRSLMPDRVASSAAEAVEKLSSLLKKLSYDEGILDFSSKLSNGPNNFATFINECWLKN